jgi:hypothetical protein
LNEICLIFGFSKAAAGDIDAAGPRLEEGDAEDDQQDAENQAGAARPPAEQQRQTTKNLQPRQCEREPGRPGIAESLERTHIQEKLLRIEGLQEAGVYKNGSQHHPRRKRNEREDGPAPQEREFRLGPQFHWRLNWRWEIIRLSIRHPMTRRHLVFSAAALAIPLAAGRAPAAITLPKHRCFIGEEAFTRLIGQAKVGNWKNLPIGQRIVAVGRALEGVPYAEFTLEIDDRIECPSVNFHGLDCWTFFETALAVARLLGASKATIDWTDLLAEIEWTRYRGGVCTGGYLERIHYLDEWFFDNAARGTVVDLTPGLPGARRLRGRRSTEMTDLWRSYRYLRENPDLRPGMRRTEEEVEKLPVWYVPKASVAAIEPRLEDGDILGIVTHKQGVVCSHVGLAVRDAEGALRLLHASQDRRAVVLDSRLSDYLQRIPSHAGVIAARPLEIRHTIRDPARYQQRLRRLKAGKSAD